MYSKAAKVFNVPRSTRRIWERSLHKISVKSNFRKWRILKTKSKFFGTSTKHIQLTIYQLANVRNSIEHPFRNSMAGKGWIDRFLTRYRDEIVSLTPTDASAARTLGFDRENVNAFFYIFLIKSVTNIVILPIEFRMQARWGFYRCTVKSIKSCWSWGEKSQMANLTAAERGASITVTRCMKAAENFAPLMIIFPRKNENKLLTKVTLCESFGTYHPSGWIRTPPFTQRIQRFVNFIRSSEESSISLISNGRYSDTRNVDVMVSNNIF